MVGWNEQFRGLGLISGASYRSISRRDPLLSLTEDFHGAFISARNPNKFFVEAPIQSPRLPDSILAAWKVPFSHEAGGRCGSLNARSEHVHVHIHTYTRAQRHVRVDK